MKTFNDYLEAAKIPSITDMYILFTQINKDSKKSGDQVISLTNWDYYSHQIQNIYEVDDDTAESLAKQLAQYVKDHRNKIERKDNENF